MVCTDFHWISPLGVGLTGSAMFRQERSTRRPKAFEGGASPLPCLHVVTNLCSPHHPRFALLPPPGGRAVRGDCDDSVELEQEHHQVRYVTGRRCAAPQSSFLGWCI